MHWIAPSEKENGNSSLEKRLWAAADQFRANSGLTAAQYSQPVLGLIFLRFAEVRFSALHAKLEKAASSSRRGSRVDDPGAYHAESVLYLTPTARFDHLLALPEAADVGKAINDAMRDIEKHNAELAGVLPKTYNIFTSRLLKELLKTVSEIPASSDYDAFGRIYEYFLGEFARTEGQKGGEFYTPSAIVRLLTEIIEPYHGRILDPACGSGGMFVSSARFVAEHKKNPASELSIHGIEKTDDTGRLCRMNLAVHGLDGDMHAAEESDFGVVPVNQPNKGGEPLAEVGEGRPEIKENIAQSNTRPTQSGESVSHGLSGVRQRARERKQEKFTALLHHLTVDLLRESYFALQRKAAPGVDGETWRQYGTRLEDRLADLHSRVHRGAYRAKPSRRVYILKADGRQRPLGIAALEDKVVQQAVVTILNQIYEVDFKGFSYGFRPEKSPHQALDALWVGLVRNNVNWVLDADIRSFFDRMSHEWTMQFVRHRVADDRILRLIQKWLKAGVLEEGEWKKTEVGTPQGAVISPLLANLYLHYVFDLWVEAWRKTVARGQVIVVRYADDLVVGFQHRADAERFLNEFRERLAKFDLELHPEKTRLLEFGRYAARDRRKRGEKKPETFTFLGFVHQCGTSPRGLFTIWRRTAKKRMVAKLKQIKQTLRRRMHEPLNQTGTWLRSVSQGFYQYHAVPGNLRTMSIFRYRLKRLWQSTLRHRSQRPNVRWERIGPLFDRWLPPPRLLHPYPGKRFDATHPR